MREYDKLEKSLFPELKWEDGPIEVKLVPSTAEVIVVPSQEEIEAKIVNYPSAKETDGLEVGRPKAWLTRLSDAV